MTRTPPAFGTQATRLHAGRYRIQPSPATHGTDFTYPQRLVVARYALSPGVRLRALPPWAMATSGGRGRPPGPR